MPIVMPVSELQRNMGGVAKTCHETKEPIYLTKNGKASLVVMDAIEFDSRFAALEGLREHEERVHRAISRGYDDKVPVGIQRAASVQRRQLCSTFLSRMYSALL